MALTSRQRRFADEYVLCLNGTKAALRADCTPVSAAPQAWRWLRDPEVAAYIDAAQQRRAEAMGVTRERVIAQLARIAFANMAEFIVTQPDGSAYIDLSAATADQLAAVQEITSKVILDNADPDATADGSTAESTGVVRGVRETRLKLHSPLRALELLGLHLGLKFSNRVELTGANGGPIQVAHSMVPLDRLSLDLRRRIVAELESQPPAPAQLTPGTADSRAVIDITPEPERAPAPAPAAPRSRAVPLPFL